MAYKKLSVLLLSGCAASLLASCAVMDEWKEGITGQRSKEQIVDGPRRVPVLNQKSGALAPEAAPMVTQAAPVQPVAQTPAPPAGIAGRGYKVDYTAFDRYDDQGNEIVPPPADAAASPSAGAAPAAEAGPHKDFSGNPSYSKKTEETAPLPPAPAAVPPQSQATPLMAPQAQVQQLAAVSPAAGTPAAPQEQLLGHASDKFENAVSNDQLKAMPEAAPAPAEDEPGAVSGFFSRLKDTIGKPFAGSKPAPAPAAAADAQTTYPALSATPATPAQFDNVQADKDLKIQQMQEEHAIAAQEKQTLDSEPSALAPVPDETPAAPVQLSAEPAAPAAAVPGKQAITQPPAPVVQMSPEAPASAPETAAATQESAPEASQAAASNFFERMLNRATAGDESSEAAPAQAEAAPAPVPAEETPNWTTAAQPEPAQPQEAPNVSGFFQRVFGKEETAPAAPAAETAPTEEIALQPVQPPAPAAPAAPAANVTLESPMPAPLLAAEPPPAPASSLPSLSQPAAPTAPVAASDASEEAAPAAAGPASGLPSPDILKKVKMLPGSRYNARDAADSY